MKPTRGITINRELAPLKRAFNLAVEAERLSHAPAIQMLEEHNARQGFVEHAEFLALRELRDLTGIILGAEGGT